MRSSILFKVAVVNAHMHLGHERYFKGCCLVDYHGSYIVTRHSIGYDGQGRRTEERVRPRWICRETRLHPAGQSRLLSRRRHLLALPSTLPHIIRRRPSPTHRQHNPTVGRRQQTRCVATGDAGDVGSMEDGYSVIGRMGALNPAMTAGSILADGKVIRETRSTVVHCEAFLSRMTLRIFCNQPFGCSKAEQSRIRTHENGRHT